MQGAAHAHLGQRSARAIGSQGRRQAQIGGAEGDVLEHGRHEELLVGILEHEADFRAHFGQHTRRGSGVEARAAHLDRPFAQ